ncbi:hypothetical protein G6F65_021418 [Rhizopus arrhizus]|nr:hypothetical protein G6F65_021418 [Rhizopus arrhizus]
MNEGATATGVVTGKPIALGGSLGRVEATGRGVFVVACEAARDLNIDVSKSRVVVQGFGNVGGTAARLFHEAGAKVIAAQDHTGTVHNPEGLDVHKLLSHVSQHGGPDHRRERAQGAREGRGGRRQRPDHPGSGRHPGRTRRLRGAGRAGQRRRRDSVLF